MDDRDRAAAWARDVLADPTAAILDTETTGLDDRAEIVQIAVLSVSGRVLLDALVRPVRRIPPDATRIHGITDAMVASVSTFADLAPQLATILRGRRVVIYNADYDTRLLLQSGRRHGLFFDMPLFDARAYQCAMLAYSAWVGEIGRYGDYRWQKLPSGDHSALGDCRATLAVLQRMAGG